MGNSPSSACTTSLLKEFETRELDDDGNLDASSSKVISSACVSHNRRLALIQKNHKDWYVSSSSPSSNDDDDDDNTTNNNNKKKPEEEFLFSIETRNDMFTSSTQVIVNGEGDIIALVVPPSTSSRLSPSQKQHCGLIYRPFQAFDDQQPSMEVYKEKFLKNHQQKVLKQQQKKKTPPPPLTNYYLFSRLLSSSASSTPSAFSGKNGGGGADASYALLQVNAVYNDPAFASFQDPPLYRAVRITKDHVAVMLDPSSSTYSVAATAAMGGRVYGARYDDEFDPTTRTTTTTEKQKERMTVNTTMNNDDNISTSTTTWVAKMTKTTMQVSNGVDILAILLLCDFVKNHSSPHKATVFTTPRSANQTIDRSGVV